ncbi:MAG TPA: hypothetical protein VMJ12_11775 [Candidatus Acidoferrales bacterium]|nr:hypothetical protein [Candidatus Acidoferrales bacterium]
MKFFYKIIIGILWLGLVALLSFHGNAWFSGIINFIERKIVHGGVPPEIAFAINIIPWNCFVSLLICLPLLFVRRDRSNTFREVGNIIIFFFFLLATNLLGVLNWIMLFPESLGDDSSAPTFSTLEPYALKDGWTPFQFWGAWSLFIIFSNVFSIGMVFSISPSRKAGRPVILS